MLITAIITITLALVFYSVGVWAEKLQRVLKKSHLCFFWIGFVFDTTGTTLMTKLAGDSLLINFHGITGLLAIALMLIHAIWATIVLVKGTQTQKASFHRFSIFVWLIWLIPFLSGMIFGVLR